MSDEHVLAPDRATRYRAQAAQLRAMADAEPLEGFRNQLLSLASDYEQLADSVERWKPAPAEPDLT
jgi:hypothetical protein